MRKQRFAEGIISTGGMIVPSAKAGARARAAAPLASGAVAIGPGVA